MLPISTSVTAAAPQLLNVLGSGDLSYKDDTSSVHSHHSESSQLAKLKEVEIFKANDLDKNLFPFAEVLEAESVDGDKASGIKVVAFLRRFGCNVCRAVATGLSVMKEDILDKLGISLSAVAIEDTGFEEFSKRQFFKGDIYVDMSGKSFKVLGFKRLGLTDGYGLMDMQKMRAALALASDSTFRKGMDFNGNLVQLGGLIVVDETGQELKLVFRETFAGDTPLVYDILKAVNAPEDILNIYRNSNQRILQLARLALARKQQASLASSKSKGHVS